MRVLVCGGRDYRNRDHVFRTLDELLIPPGEMMPIEPHVIIHGGARGADRWADDWAVVNWVEIAEYKADWDRLGPVAGFVRNQQMLDEGKPDLVVAFPGGNGTADMVHRARRARVEVREVTL